VAIENYVLFMDDTSLHSRYMQSNVNVDDNSYMAEFSQVSFI